MTTESLCGGLLIGGFEGERLPESYAAALREGRRAGAILFRHNVSGGPLQAAALARQIHRASSAPLLGIDQEGGRVVRLRAPFLKIPSMRELASWGDEKLAQSVAFTMASEMAAVGITVNFGPVLDVDTCETNPVIGDRAFSSDADVCSRFGTAWIRGVEAVGILAVPKHFPGHGDTATDSHFDLPWVGHSLERLERLELIPFRAAVAAGARALMTAHVVYEALDPHLPATLSPAVSTSLRNRIGFDGMLLTDDLEMRALADRWPIEETAVGAIVAGCDALLVCHGQEAQERALEAICHEVERSPAFASRCEQARARVLSVRHRLHVRPLDDGEVMKIVGGRASKAMGRRIAATARPSRQLRNG